MSVQPWAFSSIGVLRAKLDAGETSAEELARVALAGLASSGEHQHLVAALSYERALEEAERADRLIQTSQQGPVTGIPYGVKDQLATVGLPTSWGSAIFQDQQFDYDATVVERLKRAGAVLLAKLSMMELGGAGGYRSAGASASGPAVNPWNPEHWAGGSSGGSAAAVGAGLLPYALAGDALGSIILPSAFCGVTGLRPTYGAVSSYGSMPGSWSFGKVGVISRSAVDCACVFQIIAGADPRDPVSAGSANTELPRRPYRVAVLPPDKTQPRAVGELMHEALQGLRGLGMKVRDVPLGDRDYADLAKRIRAGEIIAAHEPLIRDPEQLVRVVDPRQREGLRAALDQPLGSYPRAIEERAYARQEIMHLFEDVDFLVAVSVAQEAPLLRADLTNQPFRQSIHMAIGALADLPGVSLPIGFGESGLPIGMTIIGRPFTDLGVLDAAAQYQEITDWHLRTPEVAASQEVADDNPG